MCSLYVLLFLIGYVSGEVIKFEKCPISATRQKACEIHEVRIDPCTKSDQNGHCKIKPNTTVTLSFDYTPRFDADSVTSQMYKVGDFVDVPFRVRDDDACLYTSCPLKAGARQSFTFHIDMPKDSIVGVYTGKVRMWKSDNHKQQCCFWLPIEVVAT